MARMAIVAMRMCRAEQGLFLRNLMPLLTRFMKEVVRAGPGLVVSSLSMRIGSVQHGTLSSTCSTNLLPGARDPDATKGCRRIAAGMVKSE